MGDGGGDLTGSLHIIKFQLSVLPPPSSTTAAKYKREWSDILVPVYMITSLP